MGAAVLLAGKEGVLTVWSMQVELWMVMAKEAMEPIN